MVQAGEMAPDFELADARGDQVLLSSLRGKPVVLFFYPRADTPGCTIEACAFRDAQGDFDSAQAVILGISPDGQADQSRFAEKFGLPYRLLCDTEHTVAEAYGAWVEKNNYGKKSMGIQRSTFVVDADGKVIKTFPRVTVEGHAAAVLAVVQGLKS